MRWLGPLSLNPWSLKAVPTDLPGVYILQHLSESSAVFPPFYVGRSYDVRRRLAEHCRCADGGVGFFRRLRPTYFSVAHVLPAQLDDVERSLIKLLAPPANESKPPPRTPILPDVPPVRFFMSYKSNDQL